MSAWTPLERLKVNVTEKSPFMGTNDALVVSRADVKWLLGDHATLLARAEAAERRVGVLEGALEGASAYIERCWYHDDKRFPSLASDPLRELIRAPIRAALAPDAGQEGGAGG